MAKLTYSMTSANLHFHEKRNGKWRYNYIVPNRYQYLCCLFIHFYCRSINLVIVAQPIRHLIYYYDIKQSGTKGREGGLVGERNDMPYTKWWLLRSIVAFTALTANWFARKKNTNSIDGFKCLSHATNFCVQASSTYSMVEWMRMIALQNGKPGRCVIRKLITNLWEPQCVLSEVLLFLHGIFYIDPNQCRQISAIPGSCCHGFRKIEQTQIV